MVIHENSKKGNIIRYNGNNRNNRMFGGGPAPNQQIILRFPGDIAINNAGYVFVTDGNNHCIRIFSPFPYYTHIHTIGSLGLSGNSNNQFFYPLGLAIERFGNEDILYVADTDNHRIQVFRIRLNPPNIFTVTHLPQILGEFNSLGTGISGNTAGQFYHPWKIVINNNILYVADEGNHRIQVFRIMINADNTITVRHIPNRNGLHHSIGTGNSGNQPNEFNRPVGIAVNNDILYIADTNNDRIQVFRIMINANNTITATHLPRTHGGHHSIGTGRQHSANNAFNTPRGITIHRHRDEDILYVADSGNHRIQVFRIMINANNTITPTHLPGANGGPHSIGTGLLDSSDYAFNYPRAITVHRHRDEYKLYIADTDNHRIQVFYRDANVNTFQYFDTMCGPPKYTILKNIYMIPLAIRNTRCSFCNFNVCTPTPHNPNNNVNGYVVKHDYDLGLSRYFHYTCINNYIISNSLVNIINFRLTRDDIRGLINDNLDNNNLEGTDFFIPDFIMLNRATDVPVNSRDTPCRLCNFPLCLRVIDTTNNLNGCIVHLHNLTNPNTYYYHYKCLSKYFTNIRLSDNPYQSPHCATIIEANNIYKLLHIHGKADAVIGNEFYAD